MKIRSGRKRYNPTQLDSLNTNNFSL